MTESKIKLKKPHFQGAVNMSVDHSYILQTSKNVSTQNETAPDTITSSHYKNDGAYTQNQSSTKDDASSTVTNNRYGG